MVNTGQEWLLIDGQWENLRWNPLRSLVKTRSRRRLWSWRFGRLHQRRFIAWHLCKCHVFFFKSMRCQPPPRAFQRYPAVKRLWNVGGTLSCWWDNLMATSQGRTCRKSFPAKTRALSCRFCPQPQLVSCRFCPETIDLSYKTQLGWSS